MRESAWEVAKRRLARDAFAGRRWNETALHCVLAAGLVRVCGRTHGAKSTTLAFIDGAADCSHESLRGSSIEVVDQTRGSKRSCSHATFIASIFAGSGPACLGLCSECLILNIGAVDDEMLGGSESPRRSAMRLADAIHLASSRGAHILQISLDLSFLPREARPVIAAIDAIVRRGTVVVVAAGQRPLTQPNPLAAIPGVIAVSGMDRSGYPLHSVQRSVAHNGCGIAAPASDIPGAVLPTGIGLRAGTSFAACFVTAAIALVCSAEPSMTARDAARRLLARRCVSVADALLVPLDVDDSLESVRSM
jgi:subtilisin family serine protease